MNWSCCSSYISHIIKHFNEDQGIPSAPLSTDHLTTYSLAPLRPLGLLVANGPEHLPQNSMVAGPHNMHKHHMGMCLKFNLQRPFPRGWSIKQQQYPKSTLQLNQVAKCFCRRSWYFSSETSFLAPTRNFWMDLLSSSSFASVVVIATWAACCESHTEALIVMGTYLWLCISSMTSHAECTMSNDRLMTLKVWQHSKLLEATPSIIKSRK